MLTVGLTGGLASGKSFVGRELERLGCLLIQADKLGHDVLAPGAETYDAVVAEFGREILRPDGSIDRRRLGAIVFDSPERLALLNGLVHPPVRARQKAILDAFRERAPNGIAVVEAAILIETGGYRHFDRLIVAICSEEQQIARALDRDGLTREEVIARMSRQIPLSQKAAFADFVIDTSGTKEETLEQTRAVYRSLRSIAT